MFIKMHSRGDNYVNGFTFVEMCSILFQITCKQFSRKVKARFLYVTRQSFRNTVYNAFTLPLIEILNVNANVKSHPTPNRIGIIKIS